MSQKSKKKTFYRINGGTLETTRKVLCPEGWTVDKASLLIQLGLLKFRTTEIGTPSSTSESAKVIQLQRDQDSLKTRLHSLVSYSAATKELDQQKLAEQVVEKTKMIESLQKQVDHFEKKILADPVARRRLEEERLQRECLELDRAELAIRKSGIREDDFYALKNQLAGAALREKAKHEEVEHLKQEVSALHNRINDHLNTIDRLNKAISRMMKLLSNTEKFELLADQVKPLINNFETLEKINAQQAKCVKIREDIKELIRRMEWNEPDPEDSLIPEG